MLYHVTSPVIEDGSEMWMVAASFKDFTGYKNIAKACRKYVSPSNMRLFRSFNIESEHQHIAKEFSIDSKTLMINYAGVQQLISYRKINLGNKVRLHVHHQLLHQKSIKQSIKKYTKWNLLDATTKRREDIKTTTQRHISRLINMRR
uniref:Baculovirus repeated ORF a n=1 Tax=Lymantria dispar multicapsid nuclear polyhedrosis virus TaxID=10449 RepID=A0A1B1MQU2_NPVLD|nr:baculovirus repeated ORF a [Lymantria dispar multiple nucleopolyhedrovirus]